MKKILALLLTLALLGGLLAGCAQKREEAAQPQTTQPATQEPEEPDDVQPEGEEAQQPEPDGAQQPDEAPELAAARSYRAAEDYGEVYTQLRQAQENGWNGGMGGGDLAVDEDVAEAPAEAESTPAAEPDLEEPAVPDGDYSETNVQVEGIDEGDIVKTDGRYIYLLRDNELSILEADGAATKELSKTILELEDGENGYEYAQALFVTDGHLAVLSQGYSYSDGYDEEGEYYYDSMEFTRVTRIDVSDPALPSIDGDYQQEGWYVDARLLDGVVYLVSSSFQWDYILDKPETFVPQYRVNGEASLVAPDDILLPDVTDEPRYAFVSALDMATGQARQKAILGGADTVYMTQNALYLACTAYEENGGEPYVRDQYEVVDYVSGQTTTILRLDPTLELTASGAVDGYLLNQFALDERDGTLRAVTTVSKWRYSVYTDETYDFHNYVYPDEQEGEYNCLYVLDDALQPVGRLEHLAEDERVYAVRYQGDYAYVVTFYETDPLFVIDLSDPANPTVASELELPGFSNYLHVWQDGRLFGLGQSVTEEGWTDGMKLSMFDVSDPAATSEITTLPLDASYSEAIYNHRAMLISPARNLIGLPTDVGYLVFSYSEEDGFMELGRIEENLNSYDCRALYIGDYLYLCSPDYLAVLDLQNFTVVKELQFAYG